MSKILFSIGSLHFYTHGVFLVLAVVISTIFIYILAAKNKLNRENLIDIISYTILAGIIGARITYYILYHDQFSSFWELFKIWEGGLVSWGGFIFAIIAFILTLRVYKMPVRKWLDILLTSALLGLALGRLGSFLSGEYAGIAGSGKLTVSGVYPITLFEASWDFIVFLVLYFLYFTRSKNIREGQFAIYAVLAYSFGRFIIDFWRDEPDILWKFSFGQIFSALVFISLFIYLIVSSLKKRGSSWPYPKK